MTISRVRFSCLLSWGASRGIRSRSDIPLQRLDVVTMGHVPQSVPGLPHLDVLLRARVLLAAASSFLVDVGNDLQLLHLRRR